MKIEHCRQHNRPLAPDGMAILVGRGYGVADKQLNSMNIQELSDSEKNSMSTGTMAFRHIVYDKYCQDTPITHKLI